jgi:Uma2 family endonuclease
MAQIETRSFLTAAEFLAFERGSEVRHEYVAGEAVLMTGGSWDHSLVIGNLLAELKARLRGSSCAVHASDLRVRTPAGLYTYPDVVVVCGEPRFEDAHRDTVLNPRLLVEVLSPSTESYDRGRKFESYRGLDSLQEYLLVSQDRPRVERFLRQENGFWLYSEVVGRDEVIPLALGCELALAAVYEGLALPE